MNSIVYIKGIEKDGYGAVSAIVCDNWGRVLRKNSLFIGETTPLKADFTALLSGVEAAVEAGASSVKIFTDNESLIRYMAGTLKILDRDAAELAEDIRSVSEGLSYEFTYIHASRNKDAERLALSALEEGMKTEKRETKKTRKDAASSAVKETHIASASNKTEPKKRNKREASRQAAVAAFRRAMLFDDIAAPKKQDVATFPCRAIGDSIPEEREERQISAGGIVYKRDGGKILVCIISKKKGKIWALPKGRVLPGEDLEDTARREIAEETGHLTHVEDILDEISYYFYVKEESVLYHKTVYFFLMPLLEEDFCQPDGEADSIIWLTPGEAYRRLSYLSEKEVMRKAQKIFNISK